MNEGEKLKEKNSWLCGNLKESRKQNWLNDKKWISTLNKKKIHVVQILLSILIQNKNIILYIDLAQPGYIAVETLFLLADKQCKTW